MVVRPNRASRVRVVPVNTVTGSHGERAGHVQRLPCGRYVRHHRLQHVYRDAVMSIVYVNAANVPANTAERYAACGREIRPGVWELDNTSECYRALAIEFAPPAKGIEGERATRRNADQTNWPRAARLISRFAVESD